MTAEQFRPTAINYIARINGANGPYDQKIADSLIQNIANQGISELPKFDFELLLNQFFNILHFDPITNLELFLTEDCNLACDYCFVREKHPKSTSWENIVSAINFLVFYSGDKQLLNLTLFGGEPLLEKGNIFRIVDYIEKLESQADNKRFSISLTTNGTLITEEVLKRTKGRINFLLSIDGDKKTHDAYRKYKNGRGSFETIISKIDLLKKYQPWLGVRMTILPDTVQYLFENVKYLYSLGINQFLMGLAMDMEWDKEALITYEEQLLKVGRYYISEKKSRKPIRITLFEKNEKGIDCHEHEWGCGAGRNTISVSTEGDIYPCSKFVGYEGFHNEVLKLGNIQEGITNIELREKMSRITDDAFPGCASCTEINACMGGCPADNYYLNRNLHKAGEAHCELKKIDSRVLRILDSDLDELSTLTNDH